MKKIRIAFVLFLTVALTNNFVLELPNYLKQDNTILVSVQKAADYDKVHITGSTHLNHGSLYNDKTMLLPDTQVAQILGENGIADDMKIVLYDGGTSKYAGRIYWVLKYMGASNVKILNGGLPAWKVARKPVTKSKASAKKVTFTPHINKDYLATMSTVKGAINNKDYVIIDARTPEEFNGTNETSIRLGYIPSAININYVNMLDAKGELKPNDELAKIFADAGATKDKTIIVYCRTSVRAGIEFFTLKSALDYPNVMVYDGAFSEWQSDSSNPVSK